MFPYEYQRALRQLAEEEAKKSTVNGEAMPNNVVKTEPKVRDIEEVVTDTSLDKKRLEKVLDKTRCVIVNN